MASTWRQLRGFDTPLLIQHSIGPKTYSVWVTNLTHIWSETLDRRGIISRAISTDLSIDPSESPDYMQQFLDTIARAFLQEDGTELRATSEDQGEHIALHLSISLPEPLQALQWCVNLQKNTQDAMMRMLVVPLLREQMISTGEKQSLLQLIKDKDRVITKLADQMQSEGCDVRRLCPGSVSSKSSSRPNVRQAVNKSMKGGAEFDREVWQSDVRRELATTIDLQSGLSKICPIQCPEALQPSVPTKPLWWMSREETAGHQADDKGAYGRNPTNNLRQESSRVDGDEFQVRRSLTRPLLILPLN